MLIGPATYQATTSVTVTNNTRPNTDNTQNNNPSSTRPNIKEDMLDFVENASDGEADARIKTIKHSGACLPCIYLKDIIGSDNEDEIMARMQRLSSLVTSEMESVHKKELNVINEGQAEGKSSKQILTDIINLYDKQSDLFKQAFGWNGESMYDPKNIATLREFTPNYINTTA